MSAEQVVEVPATRRLFVEVPHEVPVGRTILTFTPAPAAPEEAGQSATPHADRLLGILASAGDITLEQIREERLSKYLV